MFWLDTKQLDIKRKLLACPPARPHARLPACPSACTLARPAVQLLLRSQTLATRWLARQLACPVASHLPVHLFGRPPACPHSCTIALMHACMPARPRAHPPDRTPTVRLPTRQPNTPLPVRPLVSLFGNLPVCSRACTLARPLGHPPDRLPTCPSASAWPACSRTRSPARLPVCHGESDGWAGARAAMAVAHAV